MRKLANVLLFMALGACTTISSPSVVESKVPDFKTLQKGESCGFYALFFGPFGSPSLPKAIWNGQIDKVFAVEKEFNNYLLFSRDCTIVYGQGSGSKKDID